LAWLASTIGRNMLNGLGPHEIGQHVTKTRPDHGRAILSRIHALDAFAVKEQVFFVGSNGISKHQGGLVSGIPCPATWAPIKLKGVVQANDPLQHLLAQVGGLLGVRRLVQFGHHEYPTLAIPHLPSNLFVAK